MKSALGYGVGSILGIILANILDSAVDPWRFLSGSQAVRLIQGILLAFFIAGLAGILTGLVGGWFLPHVGERKRRSGYAFQSSVVFGIAFGLLVFPIILIISLLSYYDVSGIPDLTFGLVFGIVGLIFGLLIGGVLSVWTVRRFHSRVTWGATLGFTIGGIFLGFALRQMLLSATEGELRFDDFGWLGLGYFLFAAFGGFGLGMAFARIADQMREGPPLIHRLTARKWTWRMLITGGVLLIVILLIRPVMAAMGDFLTPVDATLSPVLDLKTTGTHWLKAAALSEAGDAHGPAAAAGPNGLLAVAWIEEERVMLAKGQWQPEDKQTTWREVTVVYEAAGESLADAALAVDGEGRIHTAWIGPRQDGSGTAVFSSVCDQGGCSEPRLIGQGVDSNCSSQVGKENSRPTMAVDAAGQIMLVWENDAGLLPFASWPAKDEPAGTAAGCVPVPDTQGSGFPRVAALGSGHFVLVSSPEGKITQVEFQNGRWQEPLALGSGLSPAVYVDQAGQLHFAWCHDDGLVYWDAGTVVTLGTLSCTSRPDVAVDEKEQVHILWYGDQVEDSNGNVSDRQVIFEIVKNKAGQWFTPAIAGRAADGAQPALVSADDSSLHMAWRDPDQILAAAQVQYDCDETELSDLAQIMYDQGRKEEYIPPTDPLPFCQNQYDRIIFTPNPGSAFSEQEPTLNGAFDKVAELIRDAEYEVLYSTMWYDKAANHDSPGAVVAQGVGDLYEKVKANPENYPRGMTVRVMLDNPPEVARGEFTGQLWSLLEDLRHAGVEKMVDEEIGWRLEVADYEGSMPHSHVKTVIIDGKTAVAAGFNMSYIHFAMDHPSGQGNDRVDMGLQITGPVVQSAVRMFDDMWAGADKRHCSNFNPPLGIPWQTFCFDSTATADHVPEVLKFYLPGADSTAFSLYRSKVHHASDSQIVEAVRAADESLDIIQVNLTLDMICNLNIVFDICTSFIAPDYVPAMFEAASNGAKIRIIVKPAPFEGIENNVALSAFEQTLVEAGLEDQFEVRFYEKDMHAKAVLIDDQLLVVGSQNFHYSAFGEEGLNEYNFAVEDPQAADDFKRAFERMWELSVSR